MLANKSANNGEQGTKKTVYAALIANTLIAIAKFVAGFISGSVALLAEGAHSVADTTNQIFLLLSLRFSKSPPDKEHPYGHGKERFFWYFVVAVSLFVAGAVFSVYKGITALTGESEGHHYFLIGYIVLGVAFAFEAMALMLTIRELRQAARAENRSFWGYFKVTCNTTIKLPLYNDTAALVGLVIAAAGLFATQTSGNPVYGGIASISIGMVLIIVAFHLGTDSRELLLGQAVLLGDRRRLREIVASFPEVREILRMLTMYLAPTRPAVRYHLAFGPLAYGTGLRQGGAHPARTPWQVSERSDEARTGDGRRDSGCPAQTGDRRDRRR